MRGRSYNRKNRFMPEGLIELFAQLEQNMLDS